MAVKLWLPVDKRRGGVAPGAAAVGGRSPDLGRAVEYLHRAVRFRGTGQNLDVGARRGRRRDRRRRRCHGVDRDRQRR